VPMRLCTRKALHDERHEGVSRLPGVRASGETLISRRVRETRIKLPQSGAASVSGGSHQTAVSRDGRMMDSSPEGTFLRPIGAAKIPRTCLKPIRCTTYRSRLMGLGDRIDVFFPAFFGRLLKVSQPFAGFRTIRRNYGQTHHRLRVVVRPDIPVAVLGQSRGSPGRSATCRSLLQRGSYHLSTRRRATLGRLVVRADGVRRRADANARHEPASPDRGMASISWVRQCAARVGWLAMGRLRLGLYDVPGCSHTRDLDAARALPPDSARARAHHPWRTECASRHIRGASLVAARVAGAGARAWSVW